MRLHYQADVQNNFGDALNQWLWPALLPDMWDEDGTVFVGIGTILDQNVPQAALRVVFGSGTGYAPPPDTSIGPWRIYGVRGPLTAEVMRLHPSLALTDAAILLSELPEFKKPPKTGTTLFVPHWKSVRYGSWRAICDDLGIDFVDPRDDSFDVVRRIASADKVIAESMHAAIIADAFRVPWVPIVLSREVSPFKWADWSLSLGLQYEPLCLPPSNATEGLRDQVLRGSVFEGILAYPPADELTGIRALRFRDPGELIRNIAVICGRRDQTWRKVSGHMAEAAFKRVAAVSRVRNKDTGRHFDRAYRALAMVATMPGTLSATVAHRQALETTQAALERLKFDWSHGFAPTAQTDVPRDARRVVGLS